MGPLLDTVTWYQKQITVLDGKKKNQTNKRLYIFQKSNIPVQGPVLTIQQIAFLYHVIVSDRANLATTPPMHVIDFLLTVWCYIAT